MLKIALVYPELFEIARYKKKRKEKPPLGILSIAAVLEKHNYTVSVFQINSDDYRMDYVPFDIVCFSIPASVSYTIVKLSIDCSSFKKDRLIVIGGFHSSLYPKDTLANLKGDIVCIGESEDTILDVLKAFSSRDFSQIRGVCYMNNNLFVQTPKRELMQNIDSLPFPARHLISEDDFLFYEEKSNGEKIRMTHIMFSRGCPFNCYFCASQQKIVQFRSGESIRAELIHLKQKYAITGFSTVDDNSIINKKIIKDICDNIRDLELNWKTLSRVDRVEKSILQLMYSSGCYEIQFGVESGSQTILDSMNKKITVEQIEKAICHAFDIGINVKLFIIHGFPGENLKTTDQTIQLLHKFETKISKVNLFRFVPLPGSFVYENYEKFKIKDTHYESKNNDWSNYHIYYNSHHWWGSKEDFDEMNKAYAQLSGYVQKNFK